MSILRWAALAAALMTAAAAEADEPSVALFNGRGLDGWVNVNGAPGTWSVRDGILIGSGKPSGFLHTEDLHEITCWNGNHARRSPGPRA